MLTNTGAELGFAIIAFFICMIVISEVDDIFAKLINHKKSLQLVCVCFLLLGAYTTLNGVVHLGSILDVWNWVTGDADTAGKVVGRNKGVLLLIFLVLWPILSILFGLSTIGMFLTKYAKQQHDGR
jgi:hypothetical protein